MTTKLDKNVRKIIAHHGGTVVQRGVTGGVRGMRVPPCESGMVCGHQD